ncbi:hypothetical protein Fmac_026678 [Flemingia macrophylla]|uniref:Uncharacterized protein n=1 Tax=Flemingia macrophylla TaxID=520843 RepID=A0ABD1LFJ5_9FABA
MHRWAIPVEIPLLVVWLECVEAPQELQMNEKSDDCGLQYRMPQASIALVF